MSDISLCVYLTKDDATQVQLITSPDWIIDDVVQKDHNTRLASNRSKIEVALAIGLETAFEASQASGFKGDGARFIFNGCACLTLAYPEFLGDPTLKVTMLDSSPEAKRLSLELNELIKDHMQPDEKQVMH